MKEIFNPYRILKVDPEAPQMVIKAAYRALLKSGNHHPDLGGTEDMAKTINEAYAILKDEKTRLELDRRLAEERML